MKFDLCNKTVSLQCIKTQNKMNELLSYITIDPEIRPGKPIIKGTRITICDILQWLASGMNIQDILEDFPLLKEEHIRAALAFAANREANTKIFAALNYC